MRNLVDNIYVVQDITPASASTASMNGTAVDWSKYREAVGIINVGALSAGGSIAAYLDHCDTSNMVGFVVVDTLAISAGSAAYKLGVRRSAGSKKYIRVRCARTGKSMLGATLVLGEPQQGPVT